MKHLKYFESVTETQRLRIDSICYAYNIKDYTINSDGKVDVYGDVYLNGRDLKEIPLKFGYVSGDFYCSSNYLSSLRGSPERVGGDFDCRSNQLTSLEGGPKKVRGNFHCYNNEISSLQEGPEEVGGDYDAGHNSGLKTLLGVPKEIGGYFWCSTISLPKEIKDNYRYINEIVKYQNDYNIWRRDGTLDAYRFSDMMKEILEEQK